MPWRQITWGDDDNAQAELAQEAWAIVVQESNQNLMEPENELLWWHFWLGHMGLLRVQFLMQNGGLAHSKETHQLHQACCKLWVMPKCAACLYGKQMTHSNLASVSSAVRDRVGVMKQEAVHPSQKVYVDHIVCSTTGRLFSTCGKLSQEVMYIGVSVFVDVASGLIHGEFQTNLDTHQTMQAKESFEHYCQDSGIVPQTYVSDNGICLHQL